MPVAHAPATEMCGSEPRLGSAQPCASSSTASWANRVPPATRTVRAAGSMTVGMSRSATLTRSPSVSAMRLNECAVPSARMRALPATSFCSSLDRGGAVQLLGREGDVAGPVTHRHDPTVVRGWSGERRSGNRCRRSSAPRRRTRPARPEIGVIACSSSTPAGAVERPDPLGHRSHGEGPHHVRDRGELDRQIARTDLRRRQPASTARARSTSGSPSANGASRKPPRCRSTSPPPRPTPGRPACPR